MSRGCSLSSVKALLSRVLFSLSTTIYPRQGIQAKRLNVKVDGGRVFRCSQARRMTSGLMTSKRATYDWRR